LRRLFFLFAVLIIGVALIPLSSLSIYDDDSHYNALLGDVRVTVEYNHSVEHSEVIEILEANSSGIYVRKMLWSDFGAGLPEDIQGMENGYYYKDVDQYLGKGFDYWFIPFNRARIIVGNRTVLAPKHAELVKFRVKKCPLILIALRRC